MRSLPTKLATQRIVCSLYFICNRLPLDVNRTYRVTNPKSVVTLYFNLYFNFLLYLINTVITYCCRCNISVQHGTFDQKRATPAKCVSQRRGSHKLLQGSGSRGVDQSARSCLLHQPIRDECRGEPISGLLRHNCLRYRRWLRLSRQDHILHSVSAHRLSLPRQPGHWWENGRS